LGCGDNLLEYWEISTVKRNTGLDMVICRVCLPNVILLFGTHVFKNVFALELLSANAGFIADALLSIVLAIVAGLLSVELFPLAPIGRNAPCQF
jgi:hypothetical protein